MISLFFQTISSEINTQGLFAKYYNDKIINIEVSGSSLQYINGTKQMTKPEYAIYPWDKKYDWCSECAHSYEDHPFITFSIQSKKIKINGYFLRVGCCYDGCCCDDGYYNCFDCCLYSWSLQISDDKKEWKTIHKVEKDSTMRICSEKTYKLDATYVGKYVRLFQDQPCPGYPPCIAFNKFDIHGFAVNDDGSDVVDENDLHGGAFHDDDEDISIIGHISKNTNA
ncbi:hypothetical protein TVAG_334940 [Trichomonas vaginalis G3]|uniref:F5/8 type C domain-containing protein n=1 Tax=Trichomonas vaginalis (strain ATCC PRA-98 / G3) TaxID=412133 RepID=A2FW35_TRIV3|nr:galactose-binding domain-like family [Trichomonas vaginalis G3]EAX90882.1 hypothetical protein TVAG_334940 [Trichomonas vaginalis G3]KAI5504705.1 galactose-binding domain-like family [Trichomonas vaginalis G3]|eukprot:XP_001303812.1 hypothetical protein [Trichomonas vaginalis G3]